MRTEAMPGTRASRLGVLVGFALVLSSVRAWANSATPFLFGKEVVRMLAWWMTPFACVGLLVGLALVAVAFSPRFVAALDSSFLVFSRGVVSVVALSTFTASLFCLTLALMVIIESRLVENLAAICCFVVLPTAAALLFTAELGYASALYARVHRAKGDSLSRVLSVSCLVLAVPGGLAALASAGVGASLFLETLRVAQETRALLWGLGGVAVSAALGLGGLVLALSGRVKRTAAVLGRGAVMVLSVAIFALSAIQVAIGIEASTPRGAAQSPFVAMALFAFVLLLLAAEFAIGALLHFGVARREGRSTGKWLGGASLGVASLFGVGALGLFGLGLIGALLGA
ncbi:MAG: hypothetical protein IT377_12670 [Polyangiaceae bacterium]|nr:hypothetical protein [Polyangiaceae bacterium]